MPAPGRVSYQSRSVIGYWFKDGDFEVPPGDGPLVVEVKAVPAGAIVGRVLDADGKPAVERGEHGGLDGREAAGLETRRFHPVEQRHHRHRGAVLPRPAADRGDVRRGRRARAQQAGEPAGPARRVEGDRQVELRMARPASAGGRVVGPDGKPLAGVEVTLS